MQPFELKSLGSYVQLSEISFYLSHVLCKYDAHAFMICMACAPLIYDYNYVHT